MDISWIDRIHTRLLARYGVAWLRKWGEIDMSIVRDDWAQVLDGISAAGIKFALDRLPSDHPPNATQFRDLCVAKPAATPLALEAPKADPAVAAAALGAIKRPRGGDPKAWAYRLRDDERTGGRLTQAQRDMWRAAIGDTPHQPTEDATT